MRQNLIVDKSFDFSLRIIELYKELHAKNEYVLSKQLLRSGTSIGANVREGVVSQSKKEFIAKLNIALKEAHETDYWLALLSKSGYLSHDDCPIKDIDELIKILTAIIKTSNQNTN
jgi:four helix bundle protein